MLRSLISVCVLTLSTTVAQGAVLSVFADIDMFAHAFIGGDTLPAGNQQVAVNIIGAGQNVFMSSRGGEDADSLFNFYNSQAGVSVSRSGAVLDGSLLASVDLLVIDIGFRRPADYSGSERGAIADFLNYGGNVMMIAENDEDVGTYNSFLSDIGSSISFESPSRCCGGNHNAETILPTVITAGVSLFDMAAANNLLGGTAAIRDGGFTVAAYEVVNSTVPIPGAVWLFGSALGVMGWMRRKGA